MSTRSAQVLVRPLVMRFEKLTLEKMRSIRLRAMKPAVYNGEVLELLVKEEPFREYSPEEVHDPIISDEDVSLPLLNLEHASLCNLE